MARAKMLFSEKRIVKWGECDPAGVIYTPRVFSYAMDALETFFRQVLGTTWLEVHSKADMGMLMVRAEIDYISPLKPDKEIQVDIRIEQIGNSSVTYLSSGFDADGQQYFRVTMTNCFVFYRDFKPAPIPRHIRSPLLAYKSATSKA